eukprot:316252-Prymnesium_polylepis.2
MRAQLVKRPALHPLMLVLKLYLKQNDWDDPASGGLGSFLLFVMVRAATSHNPSNDLGVLLLETLAAFCKLQPDPKFNHRLRVLDPCDASNNLARTFSRHRLVCDDLNVRLSSLAQAPCLSKLLARWPIEDAAALRAASKPHHAVRRYMGGAGKGAARFKGGGKGAGKSGGKGGGKASGRGAGIKGKGSQSRGKGKKGSFDDRGGRGANRRAAGGWAHQGAPQKIIAKNRKGAANGKGRKKQNRAQ